MLLSELENKSLLVNGNARGVCRGIGISLKSYAVKYLLCGSSSASTHATDFSVPLQAVENIDKDIRLSRLRPVFPKTCAKLFLELPVFSFDGLYLGNLADVELSGFMAIRLFTDRGECYPISAISACSDAVILRKEQLFPLGRSVPAPMVSTVSDKNERLVTKALLRSALRKGALIKLTLSLAPFNVEFHRF